MKSTSSHTVRFFFFFCALGVFFVVWACPCRNSVVFGVPRSVFD